MKTLGLAGPSRRGRVTAGGLPRPSRPLICGPRDPSVHPHIERATKPGRPPEPPPAPRSPRLQVCPASLGTRPARPPPAPPRAVPSGP